MTAFGVWKLEICFLPKGQQEARRLRGDTGGKLKNILACILAIS